jgi:hypothetical protein
VDTRTLLIVIAISALVLIAGPMIAFGHQARTSIDKRVEATITHIQVEASALSSWWMVIAEWSDPDTGRVLTFRSHRINFPPHHRIGEQIIVNFNANEPKHSRLEL